jgi:hypothetical protein
MVRQPERFLFDATSAITSGQAYSVSALALSTRVRRLFSLELDTPGSGDVTLRAACLLGGCR